MSINIDVATKSSDCFEMIINFNDFNKDNINVLVDCNIITISAQRVTKSCDHDGTDSVIKTIILKDNVDPTGLTIKWTSCTCMLLTAPYKNCCSNSCCKTKADPCCKSKPDQCCKTKPDPCCKPKCDPCCPPKNNPCCKPCRIKDCCC